MAWLGDLSRRIGDWFVRHGRMLADPESMVGWFIVTLWCVLAGLEGGWIVIAILLTIGWFVHAATVESGNHVMLWMTTAMLLVLIVLASQLTFDGLAPVLLAAAGSTALIHNELVRINYTRRRNAMVHDAVYHTSALGIAAVAAMAAVGVALTQIFANGGQRTWLWMPIAAAALLVAGFALSLGPLRKANEASRERWVPGGRIPPQPLKDDSANL